MSNAVPVLYYPASLLCNGWSILLGLYLALYPKLVAQQLVSSVDAVPLLVSTKIAQPHGCHKPSSVGVHASQCLQACTITQPELHWQRAIYTSAVHNIYIGSAQSVPQRVQHCGRHQKHNLYHSMCCPCLTLCCASCGTDCAVRAYHCVCNVFCLSPFSTATLCQRNQFVGTKRAQHADS